MTRLIKVKVINQKALEKEIAQMSYNQMLWTER
ncbi:MAG: hypothetical protein XD75_0032 [Parcubacteria bacterium 33_209]|jgi:hypothetical protein|nr:MAG: hypothetical protein XD75_0032 [Parcubacteria bacterium 33_209]